LQALTPHSFFRFVTLLGSDGPFGFIDGRLLLPTLTSNSQGFSFSQFADAVNHGTTSDRDRLSHLPGFLPASAAVAPDSDKRDVLEKMELLKVDWLPVVDSDGHVVGVVDQSRLTASLILDVANQLQPPQQPVK
jgi:CBS domain